MNKSIDNAQPFRENAHMWNKFKSNWKQNAARSVGFRTGARAYKFLFFAFAANIGLILAWFVPLLVITKFAVVLDFVPAQIAGQVAIFVMEIIALVQLLFLACTKRGDKLITLVASKIEAFFNPAKFKASPILPKSHYSQDYVSYIPPVPTSPPRARRA